MPPSDPLGQYGNGNKNEFGLSPNMMNTKKSCKIVMLGSEDKTILEAAQAYVENFMLGENPTFAFVINNAQKADVNKTKVYTFDSRDKIDEFSKKN